MIKLIKKVIQWLRANIDADLYDYYDIDRKEDHK